MAVGSFILMFGRHIWVWFRGKVGTEQMRCAGNYFELCSPHSHRLTYLIFGPKFEYIGFKVL